MAREAKCFMPIKDKYPEMPINDSAEFIGFHLTRRLLDTGYKIVRLDNLNEYYNVSLKETRLNILKQYNGFSFAYASLEDKEGIQNIFSNNSFDITINLAAQAGVRYSLKNPHAYINSNVVGFLNILESCRHNSVKHLIYRSSSSVYGANTKMPFSVHLLMI